MDSNHGFQTATETDHRAWLWVVSLLSLIYSLLCMGARCTCKWEQLWYDDAVLGLGYIVAAGHFGTIFHSISSGMGASALYGESSHMGMVAEYYFASRILAFVTLCLSKVSVLLFIQSIFTSGASKKRKYFAAAYAFAGIYGAASVLLSSAACNPQQALANQGSAVCDANIARWGVITALDIATELVIVALPAFAISGVQVMTSKKRLIVFVFSFRLALIVFSIMVMVKYFDFLRGSRSEVDLVQTVAWQEIQIGFSLISASIPCIRTFLWAFMSMGLTTTYGSHYSASGSRGGSQQLQSMQRSDAPLHPSEVNNDRSLRANASRFLDYKVDVKAMQRRAGRTPTKQQDGESGSVNSNSSEQMIIQRKREVEVHFT